MTRVDSASAVNEHSSVLDVTNVALPNNSSHSSEHVIFQLHKDKTQSVHLTGGT